MKIILSLLLLNFGTSLFGEHHGHDDKDPREYYDYDTEGTRKDRINHNIGHGTLKVLTTPFRGIRWMYSGTKRVVRGASHHAEMFLSDAASINGNREHLHDVLRGWENSNELKDIMDRERRKDRRFLFGLPHDAWRPLKTTLYTAGFRLPRAGWRALKITVVGTRHFVGI